jgi:adenylate kinase family enzyme
MEAYERSTRPLIAFYRERKLLISIAATGTPDEICRRTLDAVGDIRKSATLAGFVSNRP